MLVLVTFHSLPGRLASTVQETWMLALLPLAGVLVVGTTGFTLVFQMWFWRDRLKAKFGQGSYQRVFLFGFGGVVLVLTLALNVYLPFSSFSPSFWQEPAVSFLATPLERYASDIAPAIFCCRIGVAMLCLVMGFTMFARAMQAFGFDYMTLVYLYFPEESTLQDNEIYSVIRHPTYSAALTISIGGLVNSSTFHGQSWTWHG